MSEARFPKPAKRSKPKPAPAERKAAAHAREVRSRAKARARASKAARIAKRKTKPMSKPELIDLADKLHSIYIRAQRNGCELAGWPHAAKECPGRDLHPSELQCAHGWDRGAHSVRYDPSNTYAIEMRCHAKYTRNHRQGDAQWHDWMAQRLGEQVYQELRERARPLRQWEAWELVLVIRERLLWIYDLPDTLRREWAMERIAALESKIRRALENTKGEP